MPPWQMTTPVAFFIFNRPDTTARVFEAIKRAAPPKLLLVADGPRPDRPGEAEKCAATRAIATGVDWPCEVLVNFSDENLGCRRRVSSGLNWVFESVDEAIILEDDCLPDLSFFRFCDELLTRYRDDSRIAMISGNNFQQGAGGGEESYYFSRYPEIWGWASWRRAWGLYDVDMKVWPKFRNDGWLERTFPRRRLARFWRDAFDAVHSGGLDTWDYQFTFSCLRHNALCVMPSVNLVSNLGFGADATHTKTECRLSKLPIQPMSFPLRHPHHVVRDIGADRATEKEQHNPLDLLQKLRIILRLLFGRTAVSGSHAGAAVTAGEHDVT